MSKEDINKINQIFSSHEKEEQLKRQAEAQLKISNENKEKTEAEKRVSLNLERLKKTGIVELFEEIKKTGLNEKSFNVEYLNENTEINLIWDHWSEQNPGWDSDNTWGRKLLRAKIDSQNRLFLQKRIEGSSFSDIYIGSESIVEDNLVELVGQKMIETKSTQFQKPQIRKLIFFR